MTDFDRQIDFYVTRSPFHFNLSIRWFTDKMLVLDYLDIDGKIDTGSALAATGSNEDRQ